MDDKQQHDLFRTEITPEPLKPKISYQDQVMLIGSCFTEHIGEHLANYKLTTDLNPFGIVYNPLSIASQINALLDPAAYSESDLIHHLDLWHSPDHHGKFSHPDKTVCLNRIYARLMDSARFLRSANFLILTLGSARAYFHRETDQLFSNCHQIPATQFTSRMLSVEEITQKLGDALDKLCVRQPTTTILLNISPVRYLSLGNFDNQVSKSTLILAARNLVEHNSRIIYFPSYEIFMDDLRDYRFYEDDMIHPGSAGVEYVWNLFVKAAIDRKSRVIMQEIDTIRRAMGHRSKGFMTPAHQLFLDQYLKKVRELSNRYPFLDFSAEEHHFNSGVLPEQS